jgi:hypothetical protein
VPTDHGREAACQLQNRHTWCAGDRTAEPWWPTVGAGLLLLSLALPETVARMSLPVTTPCSDTSLHGRQS